MKKHIIKFLTLALCVAILSSTLSGCGLLEHFGISLPKLNLPFLGNSQEATESNNGAVCYTLPERTTFHTEPAWDAPLVATFEAGVTIYYGTTVTLDGVVWAETSDGWFVLEGEKPVTVLESYPANEKGFVTAATAVHGQPSRSSMEVAQVNAGNPIYLTAIAITEEGTWGQCEEGWIQIDCVYIVGQIGHHYGCGVTRENDVVFLSAPGVQSHINATAASGVRFEILEQINIEGHWWGYTESGWVAMNSVYVEGTTGQHPCQAMVIDPTPLNVRVGPGTDQDVLFTLQYGQYVNILEQVERNGSAWGYTGEGWIFMGLTEIQ